MEIGEPVLLARLPRAGAHGSTKFCQVYGLRAGQRKKRHEVCAAVDGNSLNIFEIANGRNVASWPIPPDMNFVCQPYSERLQQDRGVSLRRSWCVTSRRGQLAVQCFEQRREAGAVTPATTSHALSSTSPVLRLDSNGADGVVVVQEDGTVNMIGMEVTSSRLQVDKLHAARTFALTDAVLRSRADLFANLGAGVQVLVGAYQGKEQPSQLKIGFWTLALSSTSTNTPLQPVISHTIEMQGNARRVDIDSTGKLEVDAMTYDLAALVPQKMSVQVPAIPGKPSKIELSQDIHLYVTPETLQIYNQRFGTILASSDVSRSSTLKRKRDNEANARLSLIAYYSQMRRVLAYNGFQLLTIDIAVNGGTGNPFKQAFSLMGNILRGQDRHKHEAHARSSSEKSLSIGKVYRERNTPNWPLVSKELDSMAEKDDTQGFEDVFKKTFDLHRPKDFHFPRIPSGKIDYFLAKVFELEPAHDKSRASRNLKVKFLPTELLQWCILGGYVDSYRLASALGVNVSAFEPGTIAHALICADPELQLLEYHVNHAPYLEVSSVTYLIRYLVLEALTESKDDAVERGDRVDSELTVSQQLIPGSHPDELSSSSPTTKCLSLALKRLASAGPTIVSRELRTLDQHVILAVIQFLRQQMFLGGYSRFRTEAYPSPPPSEAGNENKNSNPNPQIDLSGLVTLLNGCVDAIGPVGILGSEEFEAFIQKMVPDLLSEISGAGRAVEDSTFLQGLVRETLRYAESVERQPFEARNKVEDQLGSRSAQKGHIVTLYAEPETGTNLAMASALPLSLKAEEDLETLKIRKGGQMHKKSGREIGMLKDRLKSPYSFERLVL